MSCPIITPFGTTPAGEAVYRIILNNGKLTCEVITFGAAIRSLRVPDRSGSPVDVVLGHETLDGYIRRDGYLGATVGRFANRIAGGRFSLNGQTYKLAVNNGKNHLHGGRRGFSHRVWRIAETGENRVTLSLHSPDGEEGYPGTLDCKVRFSLEENSLSVHYWAKSDKDTLCNLTNHSYFNLAGHGSGSVLDQLLQLFASSYTPVDTGSIPLGMLEPVAGTVMDWIVPTPIGARIRDGFLNQARGYDHNYAIDGAADVLRPAALAYSAATGITMQMQTTMPGMQLYTANFIRPGYPGKGGCAYGPHHGFCLETQFFPDSPNQPQFPSPVLKAGAIYDHTTLFTFSCGD